MGPNQGGVPYREGLGRVDPEIEFRVLHPKCGSTDL